MPGGAAWGAPLSPHGSELSPPGQPGGRGWHGGGQDPPSGAVIGASFVQGGVPGLCSPVLGEAEFALSPGTLEPGGVIRAMDSAEGEGGWGQRPCSPRANPPPPGRVLRPPAVAPHLGPLAYFEHRCAAGMRGWGWRWGWGHRAPAKKRGDAPSHPTGTHSRCLGSSGVQPSHNPRLPAPNEGSAATNCLGPPLGCGVRTNAPSPAHRQLCQPRLQLASLSCVAAD